MTSTSYQTVNQTAEAEQYLHAEQEERKKFIITGKGYNGTREDSMGLTDWLMNITCHKGVRGGGLCC